MSNKYTSKLKKTEQYGKLRTYYYKKYRDYFTKKNETVLSKTKGYDELQKNTRENRGRRKRRK